MPHHLIAQKKQFCNTGTVCDSVPDASDELALTVRRPTQMLRDLLSSEKVSKSHEPEISATCEHNDNNVHEHDTDDVTNVPPITETETAATTTQVHTHEHAIQTDTPGHQNKYIPKVTHDVYIGGLTKMITEGAVRSYLRDIGVMDIIRVTKISDSGFRVIIGDPSIENTVYGPRKFNDSAVVMSFKNYRLTKPEISFRKHETDQTNRKTRGNPTESSNPRHIQAFQNDPPTYAGAQYREHFPRLSSQHQRLAQYRKHNNIIKAPTSSTNHCNPTTKPQSSSQSASNRTQAQNTLSNFVHTQPLARNDVHTQLPVSNGIHSQQHASNSMYSSQPMCNGGYALQPLNSGMVYSQKPVSSYTQPPMSTGMYSSQPVSTDVYSQQHTSTGACSSQYVSPGIYSVQTANTGMYPQHASNGAYSSESVSHGVYSSQPVSTGVYSSQPVSTGVYSSHPVSTGVYSSQPVSTGVYSSQPVSTGVYSSQPVSTGVYSHLQANTGAYSSQPLSNGVYSPHSVNAGVYSQQPVRNSAYTSYPVNTSTYSQQPVFNDLHTQHYEYNHHTQ